MPPCERLRPGDVLLVFCRFIKPPKNKYALCVCAGDLKGAVLKGHIPDSKKIELVALVSGSRYLPQIQKQKIIDSFR
jgi:hypothetical protein